MSRYLSKYEKIDIQGILYLLPPLLGVINEEAVVKRIHNIRIQAMHNASIFVHVAFIDVEFFICGLSSVYCNYCHLHRQFAYNAVDSISLEIDKHLNWCKE